MITIRHSKAIANTPRRSSSTSTASLSLRYKLMVLVLSYFMIFNLIRNESACISNVVQIQDVPVYRSQPQPQPHNHLHLHPHQLSHERITKQNTNNINIHEAAAAAKQRKETNNSSLEILSLPYAFAPETTAMISNTSSSSSSSLLSSIQQQQPMKKTKPKPNVVVTYLRGNKKKYITGTIVVLESVRRYILMMQNSTASATAFSTTTTTSTNGHKNNKNYYDAIQNIRTAVVCHTSVNNSTRLMLQVLGHDVIMVDDVDFHSDSILIHKYVVFNLIQYSKALFVDSDAIVLKPENLPTIFSMLDDDTTGIHVHEPVTKNWSIMRRLNKTLHDNAYDNKDESTADNDNDDGDADDDDGDGDDEDGRNNNKNNKHKNSTNTKKKKKNLVFMGLDYGADTFNTGVMLYEPQRYMYEDFQLFLKETILPIHANHRRQVLRSTQRLITEWLLYPSIKSHNRYELISFCPDIHHRKCTRHGCYCNIHIYPTTLDCRKDDDMERLTKGTIAHFAGKMLQYEPLCDPKSSTAQIENVLTQYSDKARNEDLKKLNYDLSCQKPILMQIRTLYFDALNRLGI